MHPGRRHHMLFPHAGRVCPAVRCHGGGAPSGPARRHTGQREHGRVRDGFIDRELGLLPNAQPVGHGARARREQRRPGGVGGRRRGDGLPGVRYGRQHPAAGGAVRHRWYETHLRAGEPVRTGGVRLLAGPDRPAGPERYGLRPCPGCHYGTRPARRHLPAATRRRLCERPDRRRGRRYFRDAHRGAKGLFRPGHRPGGRGSRSPGGGCPGGHGCIGGLGRDTAVHHIRAGGVLHHRTIGMFGQFGTIRRREVRLLRPRGGRHVGGA